MNISGNWRCIEQVKEPLRKQLTESILNNDISYENRSQLVELSLSKLQKELKESYEVQYVSN